jgi:siroheme synthase-like protein
MPDLLPLFVNLAGRAVLLVGGGRVAEAKLRQLLATGAQVRVVAPAIGAAIREANVEIAERGFLPEDLDGAWLVVAAATPDVNRAVADAAAPRRVFVNAVDDPANATAFLTGVVRRDGVTIAISTSGDAPAVTSLIREAMEALLPRDLDRWMETARAQRVGWKRDRVAMDERKPRLLQALNALYTDPRLQADPERLERDASGERIPWLSLPEDSWL